MKPKKPMRPPNPAARALKENEFRQRIVKPKKNAVYTRKEKHKKREDPKPDFPFFVSETFLLGQIIGCVIKTQITTIGAFPGTRL